MKPNECVYCGDEIHEDDKDVPCPECGGHYHEDCIGEHMLEDHDKENEDDDD